MTVTCSDHRQRKKEEINLSVNYPFCASTLSVGRQEGHPACKKLGVGLLVVMLWLELCTSYSSRERERERERELCL